MNVRLPASVSGLTKLFRVLSLRRSKGASKTVERVRVTGECSTLSDLCQPYDDKAKNASASFSVCFHHFHETTHCRAFHTFPVTLSCSLCKVKQLSACRRANKARPFHTSAKSGTSLTSLTSQRKVSQYQSSRPRSKKRIPLSHTQEIEEVLEEHTEVILEFAQVLGCSEAAMRDMVRRDTRLVTQFDKEMVMAKMRLLLDYGFAPAEILSRYQAFARSYHHIQSRLKAMEPVRHYKYSLAVIFLSDSDFEARLATYRKEVAIMGKHSSQASFMADLLECTHDEVMTLIKQYEFLLTLPPSRLQELVTILHSFGLSVADIRSKCLMLKCPPDVARDRLQRVSDAGVFDKQLVPYILTNSDIHFEASFTVWVDNAQALGSHANEQELLMHKLQCSKEDVQRLMKRKLQVASMKSAKIKRCLDILQKEIGLSSEIILHQGGLLYFSPRRLRARWALLKSLDLSESELARELLLTERKFVAKYGYGSD